MVATTVPTRQRPNEETAKGSPVPAPAPRTEALASFGEFPFFLGRLRDEFDRLFHRMAEPWSIFDLGGWRWGLDVKDEEEAIVVRAEAPGFEPGDFDIQVRDNQLILRAEKKTETKGKEGEAREWSRRSSYQAVTIPGGINKDKVEATYVNGVLTVTLPKTAEGKGRRVTVKGS